LLFVLLKLLPESYVELRDGLLEVEDWVVELEPLMFSSELPPMFPFSLCAHPMTTIEANAIAAIIFFI
jgi:hypothetical protein